MNDMKRGKHTLLLLLYLAALSALFLNDWFWKYQLHNRLTDKLSDFISQCVS